MVRVELLVLALLCGCNGGGNALIGSWRTPDHEMTLTDLKFTFTVYTFRSNGVVEKTTYGKSIRFDPNPHKIISDELPYKLVGDALTIGDETWRIHVDSNRLQRVRDGEQLTPLERLRD